MPGLVLLLRRHLLGAVPRRWRPLLPAVAFLLAAAAALFALDRIAGYAARRWALGEVRAEAAAAAELRVAVLRSEIEKQRTLPVVLAQDPDVRRAFAGRDPDQLAAINAKLKALAEATRAGVIYLIDPAGLTIAASNAGTPESFVGSDYGFRPYFRRAMTEGEAEHFALGTVSLRPGLYLTRRVDGADGPLGVLVVKTEFDDVEGDWRRLSEPTFVTDPRHIVLVTSVPGWRFKSTRPIPSDEKAAIRSSLQFGDADLGLLPLRAAGAGRDMVEATPPGARGPRAFIEARTGVPTTDWTLHVLAPAAPALGLAEAAARSLALLVGVLVIGAAAFYLSRRRRLAEERARGASARRELEARVEARTAELKETNAQLREEMAARRRARAAADALQDELAQAGRLAMLGQIAASVAHEVNQPVAAIRAFADNADAFLGRGDAAAARANLATISGLTDRIGAITGELRAFSRKAPREPAVVSLRAVLDGTLLLIGHRLRQQGVELEVRMAAPDITVVADRIRLEQVLVNLLQNAMQALTDRPDARIRLAVEQDGAQARITVADNGPGLPQAVMAALFMPFTTTKADGLGLGLSICHDIVAELGGRLAAENRDGAVFTITLPGAC